MKISQKGHRAPKNVGNGFAARVPATLESTPKDGLDYNLVMTVDYVAGKLVCTSLQATSRDGGLPVTGEGLRAIPVARLVQQVISSVLLEVEPNEGGGYRLYPFRWPPEDFAADGPTDEALGHVARVYRWAHAVGEPPVRTLEQLGLPRGTANRWVTVARQRGLLGKAKPGAAGEVEGS